MFDNFKAHMRIEYHVLRQVGPFLSGIPTYPKQIYYKH